MQMQKALPGPAHAGQTNGHDSSHSSRFSHGMGLLDFGARPGGSQNKAAQAMSRLALFIKSFQNCYSHQLPYEISRIRRLFDDQENAGLPFCFFGEAHVSGA